MGSGIGDKGVATLVAPGAGAFKSLHELNLDDNQITDAGCAALASALDNGQMPALERLSLSTVLPGNPASPHAQGAVQQALERAIARR